MQVEQIIRFISSEATVALAFVPGQVEFSISHSIALTFVLVDAEFKTLDPNDLQLCEQVR